MMIFVRCSVEEVLDSVDSHRVPVVDQVVSPVWIQIQTTWDHLLSAREEVLLNLLLLKKLVRPVTCTIERKTFFQFLCP